jgi:hypothetical protein
MGSAPQRSNTLSRGHGRIGSIRHKISAPVELTHTTNMLAYNAPDLYPQSVRSPSSSTKSDDETDSTHSSASSPPTSPDVPSAVNRSASPEPNHLSCYFMPPGHKLPPAVSEAPKIPQRAPSHTKKASYEAASKNPRYSHLSSHSASTKTSISMSRSSSSSTAVTSVSSGSISQKPSLPTLPTVSSVQPQPTSRSTPNLRKAAERSEAPHPFGQELAQVSELAEDYGVTATVNVLDQEEQELISKGLCRFRAEDYLSEIHELFSTFFVPPPPVEVQQPIWI